MSGFFAGFILWGILTALAYHICGGIRHMLMDFGFVDENAGCRYFIREDFMVLTVILAMLAGFWYGENSKIRCDHAFGRNGIQDWLILRASAIVITLYVLYLVGFVAFYL